jgi:hypothetical protein
MGFELVLLGRDDRCRLTIFGFCRRVRIVTVPTIQILAIENGCESFRYLFLGTPRRKPD